jgi:hypothetical protein
MEKLRKKKEENLKRKEEELKKEKEKEQERPKSEEFNLISDSYSQEDELSHDKREPSNIQKIQEAGIKIEKNEDEIDEAKLFQEQFSSNFSKKIEEFLNEKLDNLKTSLLKETLENANKEVENYLTNSKISQSQIKKNTIHPNIQCDQCRVFPIVGDRYKCLICVNFDYCESCEEKNFNSSNPHPHAFIRIRKPELAPEVSMEKFVNEIFENKQPSNIPDSKKNNQIFDNKEPYNAKCLTSDLSLKYEVDDIKAKKSISKIIKMKNTGFMPWPRPHYIACLREKSDFLTTDHVAEAKVAPNDEINFEIKIDIDPSKIKPGHYKCVFKLLHPNQNLYFGDEVVIQIQIIEKDYYKQFMGLSRRERDAIESKVYEMRNENDLSVIEDKDIIIAYMKAEGNTEQAIIEIISRK